MKALPAFAAFDRQLAKEAQTVTEEQIEKGQAEAPKPRKVKPSSKLGRPPKRTQKVQIEVPARFIACSAIAAMRHGTTAQKMAEDWLLYTVVHERAPEEYYEILAHLPGVPWSPYMKAVPGETEEEAKARRHAAVKARWPLHGDRPPTMACIAFLQYVQ